jgi:ectoine hydroxylase-related dioxygenase (phytanoyl-CoA dioxygenase family)
MTTISAEHAVLAEGAPWNVEREHRRGGVRSVLGAVPAARELADRSAVRAAAASVLGHRCFPIRATYFDKTQNANWNVAWHQDLTIAVRERRDVPGFGLWSVKDGVIHVQPPVAVLERIVAVRFHLDPCGRENGPLRVIPGSHGCRPVV